jgi:hypothetical protein
VRVVPKTTVLPGQPQVATPPTVPSVAAARPAAPISPAIAQPAPTQQRRSGGFVRWLLVLVLLLGIVVGVAVFVFPDAVGQVVPGLIAQPTQAPTEKVYVYKGTFTLENQEIIVPAGKDVTEAYREVFLQIVRQDPKYGPEAIINSNAPPTFTDPPEKLSDEPGGTRYRATMQGMVYVPQ